MLYLVVVVAIQKVSGVPYTDFGDSAANMWRGVVVSLAVGSVVVGGLGLWLGWWGAAMRDVHRARVRWALIAPVIYALLVVLNLVGTDWGKVGAGFLVAAVALGVLVGFAEEFVCRGLLLVGLRGSVGEVGVWAWTCACFGLMHGVNILLGAPISDTVTQMVMAGIQGSGFYILRRYFGSLVWAMALHGLWDFAVFVQAQSGMGTPIGNLFALVAAPLALAGGFMVARRTARGPVEDYARRTGALPAAA